MDTKVFLQNQTARPTVEKDKKSGSASRTKNVAIVGLGYVGLPLALVARARGHRVVGIESDARRQSQIQNASVPDLEDHFTAALRREPLTVRKEFDAVKDADVTVICVPTPVDDDHQPDISILESVCVDVAKHLQKGKLVIIESTVN